MKWSHFGPKNNFFASLPLDASTPLSVTFTSEQSMHAHTECCSLMCAYDLNLKAIQWFYNNWTTSPLSPKLTLTNPGQAGSHDDSTCDRSSGM